MGIDSISQAMIIEAVRNLMKLSLPEFVLSKASQLPSSLLHLIIEVKNYFLDICSLPKMKRIIFTRSSEDILHLSDEGDNIFPNDMCKLLKFNRYQEESQFIDELSAYLAPTCDLLHLIILIDMNTSCSQINFIRHKTDTLFVCNEMGKTVTLLLFTSNMDMRSAHQYDVVFDGEWYHQFIDGMKISEGHCWLPFAFAQGNKDMAVLLRNVTDRWMDRSISALLESAISSDTSPEFTYLSGIMDIKMNYGNGTDDKTNKEYLKEKFIEFGDINRIVRSKAISY